MPTGIKLDLKIEFIDDEGFFRSYNTSRALNEQSKITSQLPSAAQRLVNDLVEQLKLKTLPIVHRKEKHEA